MAISLWGIAIFAFLLAPILLVRFRKSECGGPATACLAGNALPPIPSGQCMGLLVCCTKRETSIF